MSSPFCGFPPATMKFLKQLEKNNNRDWFAENKARYESDVLEPALAFISAMQKPMSRLSECVDVIPKRQGGSLMRVYRDTRFSKDKTPYKTNVGIHFRHISGRDVHAPGFYVHIAPGEVFLGAGIWHPDAQALQSIREAIDDDPGTWRRLLNTKKFAEAFELVGDSLKRPPRGFSADHPMIEDLKRKDFIGMAQLNSNSVEHPDFLNKTIETFKAAVPFVRFLCGALRLPL